MAKNILLAFVFSALLTGCGSMNPVDPPPVHAGPPAPPYAGGCTNALGKFGDAKEFPGSYIALADTACSLLVPQPPETDTQQLDSCGKDQVVTVTTTRDIHVHSIRLWIGAGTGSRFETGMCLEVVPPTGSGYKAFHKEWDKHIEEHASDQPFAVDFIIPAGSLVRLSREPHATINCSDPPGNNCATQEMAELWGE